MSRTDLAVAVISGLYVLFIYSNGVEILSSASGAGTYIARALIYSMFVVGFAAAFAYVFKNRSNSRYDLLLLGYCVLLVSVIVYHVAFRSEGAGLATKSFIAGVLQIVGFGFLLGLRPARATVAACVAGVLVVTCGFCLVDVIRSGLFSEIMGRGAGLYLNPNIAALAMLLGVMGIVGSLPHFWRLPVLSVFAVGLSATLSRSGLLTAAAVGIACAPAMYSEVCKNAAAYRRGAVAAVVILACGSLYLIYAYYSGSSFDTKMLAAKNQVIGTVVEAGHAPASGHAASANSNGMPSRPSDCESWTVVLRGLKQADQCAWLDPEVIRKQEHDNSSAARMLLMLRGMAAMADAPLLGSGLDQAFSMRPHNTYLLFGIAYGVVGMLFVPAFGLFICVRMGGWRKGLPLLVFVFLTSMISHDLFLLRDLVAGFAIVLSSGERTWSAA